MFVLELTYIAPLEEVDAVLDEHVAWLDEQYAAGFFLASGRKVPRDGGIILATGLDRSAVESLVSTDPFAVAGVCAYRVTEFVMSKTAPALEAYRQG
ncbi:hypothetical protein HS041_09515 [Planomonospora sp. ID67723]|uniref:YciI family protein n=1 Tax=Planomonospora sp. ID67723 TaxID=2738134 RepID=UPI0018C3C39D|nr:YciI family protein [Planomonospora sp. ID67723]MBG0828004.1 hypothetical protein [Planomonospora sp. ID67723]